MQENMHQQIYLPLFAASPLWLRSESNLFTRPFHNVPLNYFTNQGHGTGYCLEDKGINDIIITRNIKKKRGTASSAIRTYSSVQNVRQRFHQICLFVTRQRQQRAILQMPPLSI